MRKTSCDRDSVEHIKGCKNCVEFYGSMDSLSLMPLKLAFAQKNLNNSCLVSALEVVFLMRSLRTKILSENRRIFNALIDDLQALIIKISQKHSVISVSNILEFITSKYDFVIIENIFDAFQVVFSAIHSNVSTCNPVCAVHKSMNLQSSQTISCSCSSKLVNSNGDFTFYLPCVLTSDLEFTKQLSKIQAKCKKCKIDLEIIQSISTCPEYLIFKFIDDRVKKTFNYVIPDCFEVNSVFRYPSRQFYRILMVLVKTNNDFRYFYAKSYFYYFNSMNELTKAEMYEKIYNENMVVIGVIYELDLFKDSLLDFQTSRIKETRCGCGKVISKGENACEACRNKEREDKMKNQYDKEQVKVKLNEKETLFRCTCDSRGSCQYCYRNKKTITSSEIVFKDDAKCKCVPGSKVKCQPCQIKIQNNRKTFQGEKNTRILSDSEGLYATFPSRSPNNKDSIRIKSIENKCVFCKRTLKNKICDCQKCSNCKNDLEDGVCVNCSQCSSCSKKIMLHEAFCSTCTEPLKSTKCLTCRACKIICKNCKDLYCKNCNKSPLLCTCSNSFTCAKCNKVIKKNSEIFCYTCRSSISKNFYCVKCKKTISQPDKIFCYDCNRIITKNKVK